mmetsp:Transcript_22067/g.32606  ORF Transcript_22067/g.32606 Transcript_22067/m.32606 type:complete len:330 (-) Transcript_22067:49-1038(-)
MHFFYLPEDNSAMKSVTISNNQVDLWETHYKELLGYKSKNGNCLIPHTYPPNPPLARWVKRQRYQYKQLRLGKSASMPYDRVKRLEEIGFVWDSHQLVWDKMLKELMEYKKKHGNCHIPSKYPANPVLATWAVRQRSQYKRYLSGKQSSITPQRVALLEDCGFNWVAPSRKQTLTSLKRKAPKQDPEIMKVLPSLSNDFNPLLEVLCDMSDSEEDSECSNFPICQGRIEMSKEGQWSKPECESNPANLFLDVFHNLSDEDDETDLFHDFSIDPFISSEGEDSFSEIKPGMAGSLSYTVGSNSEIIPAPSAQSDFLKSVIADFSDDDLFD